MADKKKEHKKLWDALKKYGIETEEDLDRELEKLKPLNIGIMTKKPNFEISEREVKAN